MDSLALLRGIYTGRDRQHDCSRAAKEKHRNTTGAFTRRHACSQQTCDCCEPGWQFKIEFKITAWHMLSRAVASVFFEEHQPQKLPIYGLYAGVSRDNCLPCKRYCCAANRAEACRVPFALLVASRVNVALGNKSLPEPVMTLVYVSQWNH